MEKQQAIKEGVTLREKRCVHVAGGFSFFLGLSTSQYPVYQSNNFLPSLQSRRCREKHMKCEGLGPPTRRPLSGEGGCVGCDKAGTPCLRATMPKGVVVRIKAVHSVIEQSRSTEESGREIHFVYDDDHVWVDYLTPGK